MEHDTQEEPEETGDQSPAPESTTSKGKSCTVRGRRIPSKSSSQKKTSTPVPALDDTAEVGNLISSLQSQQERSDAIQGQITGLLSREQRSATAAWGTWFGAMAANLDPTLLPRFYRASCDMMLSFAEESRQLQIPHAGQQFVPINFDVQPRQQPQQQQQQQQQHFLRWCPRHSYVGHHGTNSRTERRVHVDVGTASPSQYSRQLELQLSTAKYSGLQQFKHNAVSCGSTTR